MMKRFKENLELSRKDELTYLKDLHADLTSLRNRISNDGYGKIYEEDHLRLDEILDILEDLSDELEGEQKDENSR